MEKLSEGGIDPETVDIFSQVVQTVRESVEKGCLSVPDGLEITETIYRNTRILQEAGLPVIIDTARIKEQTLGKVPQNNF